MSANTEQAELAVNGGPKAFNEMTGKAEPKVGIEEFMSIAERFAFTPEALERIRAAISNDDFLGDGPNLARYFCAFPPKPKGEDFEAIAREKFGIKHALGCSSGTGALHSAFVAEYRLGDRTTRAFVVEAADEAEAKKMVEQYLALVERKGGRHEEKDGVLRFTDPYRTRDGTLNLLRAGRRLVGLFHEDAAAARAFLTTTTANL